MNFENYYYLQLIDPDVFFLLMTPFMKMSSISKSPKGLRKQSDYEVTMRTIRELERMGQLKKSPSAGGILLQNPANAAWWDGRNHAEPIYVTPPEVIGLIFKAKLTALGKPINHRLLTYENQRIEKEFYNCCKAIHPDCVGAFKGNPIIHPRLNEPGLAEIFTMVEHGYLTEEQAQHQSEQINRIERILLMRAAQLVCNKHFLDQRDSLKRTWLSLPSNVPFPLTRLARDVVPPDHDDDSPLPEATHKFFIQVRDFLDHWELTGMATWDLPEPMGPCADLPVHTNVNHLHQLSVSNVFPEYWPMLSQVLEGAVSRFDLGDAARALKVRALRDEVSTFERIYRMRFIEIAVRSRYGHIHGCVERLCEVFQDYYKIESKRIDEVRRAYAHTLREN